MRGFSLDFQCFYIEIEAIVPSVQIKITLQKHRTKQDQIEPDKLSGEKPES